MKEERPFLKAVKISIVFAIAIIVISAIGYIFTKQFEQLNSSTSLPVFNNSSAYRFVIDAGHGGEDAGAIASDGTLEKDLNLSFATLLCTVLELNGNEVELTRSEDKLLYDRYGDLENYTGQKKVYDLKNRLRIAQEQQNSIYIGLHMNKFPLEKYSGLQIYYSPSTDLSYQIANEIKSTVVSYLQPNNKRPLKVADSSIYILHKAKIPAILVECGFMSNQEELSLLKDNEYQKKMCLSLFAAIVKYAN